MSTAATSRRERSITVSRKIARSDPLVQEDVMPIRECQEGGRPGFRWGNASKCWTYDPNSDASRERARRECLEQGRAIEASQRRERKR
jgi:hypothetical protein